ncbi:MAG TPA: glucosidase [Verrucomicrobiae bacterium]|nr:glucosidase [Verrucomicrobiae bacterium]
MSTPAIPAEGERLRQSREKLSPWKKWGPYLSERQWGTVREDYSSDGSAWGYFPHDHARSRAYHWGEDGLAGISDDKQKLCFSLALWNGADPILKERLFGLTNSEGNHGEDVKEYYFYLDSSPTHSYMKYLYKYPQRAYPYADLVNTNKTRSRLEMEYELLDTNVFDEDRYFDVFVEYAKRGPEDMLIEITVSNRGPEPAVLDLLPTLWFRNTWNWWPMPTKPLLKVMQSGGGTECILASHPDLGDRYLLLDREVPLLFVENESNAECLWNKPNPTPFVKDGINNFLVHGQKDKINPARTGTKCSAQYHLTIPPGKSSTVRLLLTDDSKTAALGKNDQAKFFQTEFPDVMAERRKETDEFYDSITPAALDQDRKNVMRQALAGMLWSKQHYFFDLQFWLREHNADPTIGGKNTAARNQGWVHMLNDDVISMPDKWEYPWYAAWDLAFHTIAFAILDVDFAKRQLQLMFDGLYLHPSGQIPAYEWNFGDVNPPVHAFAALYVYNMEREQKGYGDVEFLKRSFDKLVFNFSWWVNRKDPNGKNVFEGGFLGLDNIGVFDRSAKLPDGGSLEQADGTAWVSFFCQNMMEIALELARHDEAYCDVALKFAEHFLWVASAMDRMGEHEDSLWDEADGFYYDVLRLPKGDALRMKVRSLVGLLPFCATTTVYPDIVEKFPEFANRVRRFLDRNPRLVMSIASRDPGYKGRFLMSALNEQKLRRILHYMLDESEFFGSHGIRSISRYHRDHPYVLNLQGKDLSVNYQPAESQSGLFGGNSNWRGPVWYPINFLILRALLNFYLYYGDDFKVECPTGSGKMMTLFEVAVELNRRLYSIFLRDPTNGGRRPVFGGVEKFQNDPHWRDCILFYEYFHGDNGAGIGASHQTGWTGLVARSIGLSVGLDADKLLNYEHKPVLRESSIPKATAATAS